MLEMLTLWLQNLVAHMGYLGIFIATMVESTFVPIPAEVTMIPAGMLAAQDKMNYWMVLLSGTGGVIAGSLLNYWIGLRYGRAMILKYGRYIMVKPRHIEKTERFFARYGTWTAFMGRLLPGVRHYIACVAGIAQMKLRVFMIYTSLGGLIWMWTLLQVGYMAQLKAKDGVVDITILETILIFCIAIGVGTFFVQRWLMRHKHHEDNAPKDSNDSAGL